MTISHTVSPHVLLHPQRLDIAAKHAYARLRATCPNLQFAHELYENHILAMTQGVENIPRKESVADFYTHFHRLLSSMQSGWDSDKKAIPLYSLNELLIVDGAHRTAAALFYGIDIPLREVERTNWTPNYSAEFFLSKELQEFFVDFMLLEYTTLCSNCYMCIVWPAAALHIQSIPNGNTAVNIVRQIYAGESWLGDTTNDFRGGYKKVKNCFVESDYCYVLLLQAESVQQITIAKQNSREQLGMTYSAMHTTDTREQTVRMARMFFNQNSVHFLTHAQPKQSAKLYALIAEYKGANRDHVAIHGSAVMDAYGIREARDLDYVSTSDHAIKFNNKNISLDNKKACYTNVTLAELIFDPRNYFYFHGVKFVNLSVVKAMKQKRNETKDQVDVQLINDIPSTDSSKYTTTEDIERILASHQIDSTDRKNRIRRERYLFLLIAFGLGLTMGLLF